MKKVKKQATPSAVAVAEAVVSEVESTIFNDAQDGPYISPAPTVDTRAAEPAEPKRAGIKELLGAIQISDDVAGSAVRCATLFVDAIEFRRECLEKRATAKLDMERAETEKSLALRREFRSVGDKATEKNLEELTSVSPRVRQKVDAFQKADAADEYSKLVIDAFRMWRDCLRMVTDLTRNEMSAQGALEAGQEKMRAVRQQLRERFAADED